MKINEIMTKEPKTISAEANLQDAARLMKEVGTGALPVVANGKPKGIITDRDVTVRAVAEGKDPKSVKVADAMTPSVVSCYEDEDAEVGVRKMVDNKIRRVLVENREGEVIGIVSLGDLALGSEDRKLSGDTLREISR